MINFLFRRTFLGMLLSGLSAFAALPDGWNSADVGAISPAGTQVYSQASARFDLSGAGADIWGTTDQFHFVYEPWSGDGEFIVKVASLQNTDMWAKAGIMVRENLAAGSRHAMLVLTPGNGVAFQRRKVTDGSSLNTSKLGYSAPGWLKLVRRGNQFDTYTSTDGQTWNYGATDIIELPANVFVGLALTSHHAGVLASASFIQFTAETPLPEDFPNGWVAQDIGPVALAGSGDYWVDSGQTELRASGADIWGTADQFNFSSKAWTGDVVLIARLDSLKNTNGWAKAGVMIRETLTPGSAHAMVVLTPGNGVAFQRRTATGASSLNTAIAGVTIPNWVKLERWGDRFDAYYSIDGLSWTFLGSQTIPMAASVSIGLAVTSHNANALTDAVFSRLDYHTTGAPGGLWGQYFSGKAFTTQVLQRLDANVNFSWGSGSPDPLVPVDNFSARWTGWIVPDVTQAYTFSTISDDGVRLWINNQLVIDNWTNHAATENTATVTLTAGTPYPVKMEYYENTGAATARLLWAAPDRAKAVIPVPYLIPSQYPFPVTVAIVGGNNQSAVAGTFNTSPLDVAVWRGDTFVPLVNALVNFTVTSGGGKMAVAPTASLASSLFLRTDVDGTAQVYYQQPGAANVTSRISVTAGLTGAVFTSTSTASAQVPIPVYVAASAVSTSRIKLTWSGATSGTLYVIQRKATGGNYQTVAVVNDSLSYVDTDLAPGQTYDYRVQAQASGMLSGYGEPAAVTTIQDDPPVVALSAVYASGGLSAPASQLFEATVTSLTSTITKVDFYKGTTLIGTATTAPYQFAWANIPAGIYALRAVATDAFGLTGESYSQMIEVAPGSINPVALPYGSDFETAENYTAGPLDGQNGWAVTEVSGGGANITGVQAFSGVQGIEIKPDPLVTLVAQTFTSAPANPVVYIDFYAKAVADADLDAATQFWTESAGIAIKRTGNSGEIYVYDGGAGRWTGTGAAVPVTADGQMSNWGRFTIRADYSGQVWDLYLNGNMVIANVPAFLSGGFYASGLGEFYIQGSSKSSTLFDHFSAGYGNPLFADANNDGLADTWEQSNGLALEAGDRLGVQSNGVSNLQAYLNASAGAVGLNQDRPIITSLVDGSGVVASSGMVAVRVARPDGTPLAYAPVTFTVTNGASLIASAGGFEGYYDTAPVTVQTNADGVAQAYVEFIANASDVVLATAQYPYAQSTTASNHYVSLTSAPLQTSTSATLAITLFPPVAAIDFEQSEGYSLGSLDKQLGWSVVQGAASVSNLLSYSGANAVILSPGTVPAKILQPTLPVFPGSDVVYVDFYAQSPAETDIAKATTFNISGARFAFAITQMSDGGFNATLQAFSGDGQGGGRWSANQSVLNVSGDNASLPWVRLTARLDFVHKTWDLYLNGQMIAADLGLIGNGISGPTSFAVTGDAAYQSAIDCLYIGPGNPLFDDVNNDGIDDYWESRFNLSLVDNDRGTDITGNGLTALNAYVTGQDPSNFFQNKPPVFTFTNAGGNQGLASVIITNASGVAFRNGNLNLGTTGASLISSVVGNAAGTAGIVFTDVNGLAQVYVAAGGAGTVYGNAGSLPAWWQALYFGANSETSDQNPSGDGMSNWYKFQMGLNPLINENNGDLDADGVPNGQDARPNDPTIGRLRVQISFPSNGSILH